MVGYPIIIVMMDTSGIIALISTVRAHAYKFIQRELDSRGMKGLAPSHGAILSVLFREDEISMSDIARRIDRDKSTVTTLVQKLAEHGYVTKRRDSKDSRVTYVRLTRAGRALEPDFRAISRALLARTYRGFTRQARVALMEYLTQIRQNWEGR
jgi:DNA-binding MarR family transcriptional regulator